MISGIACMVRVKCFHKLNFYRPKHNWTVIRTNHSLSNVILAMTVKSQTNGFVPNGHESANSSVILLILLIKYNQMETQSHCYCMWFEKKKSFLNELAVNFREKLKKTHSPLIKDIKCSIFLKSKTGCTWCYGTISLTNYALFEGSNTSI